MTLADKIKLKLMIKRFTFQELEIIKKYIDDEYNKQRKNLLKHK